MLDKTSIPNNILQQRILLCLFAIATNTEFKKICIGIEGVDEADLSYIKKRFLTVESMRFIIAKLVNSTLSIRDKDIWGELITSFASDSTKFASLDNSLMSEYHIRYQGNGIMAYWHVDRKALCISSQIMRCSTSEVAAMLVGIINHASNALVKNHSTDTHGQSLIAFAFSYLLKINLRPRIKGVGKIKLNKVDASMAWLDYNNLEEVMDRPIKWSLISDHYDEMVKNAAALFIGTADVEVILKRFIGENAQNPLYQALLELGRAVRTIYLCEYFSSKELRIEVEEVLNVIENWNSGNNFIFFGKRGIISSNNEVDQELSILSLHLLQSSLTYVNTLMLQQVLKKDVWQNRLTTEDKRAITPLFYNHINQYGLFKLDMNERLIIEDV
jgi:TnpA family transposase